MKKTIFIICHTNGQPGNLGTLEDYLRTKEFDIIRILHPLDIYGGKFSTLLRENGHITIYKRSSLGLVNYFIDIFLSVNLLRKSDAKLFLGASNLDTLPAIFCRKILRKKFDRIIYYPRDYSKNRFNNKYLNKLYIYVEKIVVRNSDVVISNTHRAEKERMKLGLDKGKSKVIPNGVKIEEPLFAAKKISKKSFIYVGDVSREHGLYDLINVLSPVIEHLVIIGSGDDWNRTVNLAKKLKLNVELHSKKDRKFVLEYLKYFKGFGLAPYNTASEWTVYCSPVKVGEYIASGVPVIISEVPEVASLINTEGYGITYTDLNFDEIVRKIELFDVRAYNKKAENFYKIYNIDRLLSGIF